MSPRRDRRLMAKVLPRTRIYLGLRRGDVEARLDISKETDDRGIGPSDVAVFLLTGIKPDVLLHDSRPAMETLETVDTRVRITRAGGPFSTASRFRNRIRFSSR